MTYEEAIRKASACLRLSKSANEAEAALAAAKAQEIIDRYHLDIQNIDLDSQASAVDQEAIKDFGYEDPLEHQSNFHPWMIRLASIVAEANSCRCRWRREVNAAGRMWGGCVRIIGRPSDVSAVRYLYPLLKNETLRLMGELTNGQSGAYKRAFCLGVADTIEIRMAEQKKATITSVKAENPLAIMRVDNAVARVEKRGLEVANWVRANCCATSGRGFHGPVNDAGVSGRYAGREAGKQVRISSSRGGLTSGNKQIT